MSFALPPEGGDDITKQLRLSHWIGYTAGKKASASSFGTLGLRLGPLPMSPRLLMSGGTWPPVWGEKALTRRRVLHFSLPGSALTQTRPSRLYKPYTRLPHHLAPNLSKNCHWHPNWRLTLWLGPSVHSHLKQPQDRLGFEFNTFGMPLLLVAEKASSHSSRPWLTFWHKDIPKPGGGVRPIAVGEILRRLTGKCLMGLVRQDARSFFWPAQVGVAVPGGAEQAIPTVRAWVRRRKDSTDKVLVKLDFTMLSIVLIGG